MIRSQQLSHREVDGMGVLANVVRIVDSARQTLEFALLNEFELPHADFCCFGDGFERNSSLKSPGSDTENAFVSHWKVTVYHQNIAGWK
jgi:hypothetical protein